MKVTSSAVALTVDDVEASAAFLSRHLQYRQEMAADGFASLGRDDGAVDLVFLRRGLEVLPEELRDRRAAGAIVAFVVDDLDAEHERLRAEGVPITLPPREEPWGERLFLVEDPNGIVYELVEWVTP